MNLDKRALSGFVKEVEDSRLRQKAETDYQRDVFARARKQHFDVKAMRIVLQRRAMEPSKRDEQDYNVHAYELALGGKKAAMEALERGATVREAAEAGDISTGAAGNLAKVVQKSSFVDTTAKITNVEVTSSGGDAGRPSEPSEPAEQSVNVASPPERVSLGNSNGEGPHPGNESRTPVQAVPAGVSLGTGCGPAPAPADADLTIPQFLRRSAA